MDNLLFGYSLNDIIDGAMPFFINLIFALLIFYIGKWIAKKLTNVVKKMMVRADMDETLVNFLGNLLYGTLLALVIITALSKLGVNTTSAAAMLGGAALAVGMALKDQLSNFAAGVIIILFRPFNKGDFVELDGLDGTVDNISIINTTLLTPDNEAIILPNSNITSNPIINYTAQQQRRINLEIGIDYDADIKQARQVLTNVAKNESRVLAEPEITVRVTGLGDNAVTLALLAWVKTNDYLATKLALLESAKVALDEAGIDIPYPQRSVHVAGLSSLVNATAPHSNGHQAQSASRPEPEVDSYTDDGSEHDADNADDVG